MAKASKKPPPKDEDEAQSRRFLEAARAIEADGGLSPTEGEAALERLMGMAAPAKKRPATP